MNSPTVDRPNDSEGMGRVSTDRFRIDQPVLQKGDQPAGRDPVHYPPMFKMQTVESDARRVVEKGPDNGVPDSIVSDAEALLEDKENDQAFGSDLRSASSEVSQSAVDPYEKRMADIYRSVRDQVSGEVAAKVAPNLQSEKYGRELAVDRYDPESGDEGATQEKDVSTTGNQGGSEGGSSTEAGSASKGGSGSAMKTFGLLGGIAFVGWLFRRGGSS